jgi:STE24 endopeptidase
MNESRATRYQRERRRAQTAGVVAGGIVLAVLAFTGAGPALAGWARGTVSGWPSMLAAPLTLLLFASIGSLVWEALALSIAAALRGSVERRSAKYDTQRSAASPLAILQAVAISMLTFFVFGAVVLVASWVAPAWWWVIAGVLAGAGLVFALHAGAAWVARAAGARPIERPTLVELLGALARGIRVPIDSIDELPASSTLTASALVTGVGERRRVFIAADLMRDWTDDEIAVVVAHELAHHAHRDLWMTVAVDALLLAGAFRAAEWARTAIGPGGGTPIGLEELPLVALAAGVVWIASAPIRHALSRWQERRADTFALRLTGRPDAFQAAVKRLAATHLAEERPSRLTRWLFHRHPSAAERLAAAAAFQRRG